jgi:hypothetical protein
MADPISTNPLGQDPVDSNEPDFVAQLGRISGKLLSANLLRNGVDLSFRNAALDDDILYLNVTDRKIGVNTETPIFDLDINDSILSKILIADQATIDNIVFQPTAQITTTTGEIDIRPGGLNPTAIFDRLQAGNITFNGNVIENISSNQNLNFDPSGSGTVELQANSSVVGNLYATGTITLDGDLTTAENIIIGNNTAEDILTIFPKFQDNLKPASDIQFNIGSSDFRWRDIYVNEIDVSTSLRAGNVLFNDPATISSVSGNLNFNLSGNNKTTIFTNGLSTPDLLLITNKIVSKNNQNLLLDASGTGKVKFNNPTDFSGDLDVNGWVNMTGNLATTSNIIIGDQVTDVVIINTELDQDINPGTDLAFDLGKSNRRWKSAYIDDWTTITNIIPDSVIVNGEMLLGGLNNIRALTGNNDLILNSDTDIYNIEDIRFQDNNIINLLNSPLKIGATGIGYYNFQGDNGMVLPSGNSAERPLTPEVGDTRWNTELGYLECFDGSVYIVSIGPGDQLTVADAEELNTIYSLFLG